MVEEKKADGGNGKGNGGPNKEPETIQIIITLHKGEAIVTGNISPSPVISLGLLEDAKIKLISFYSQMRMKTQMNKKEIFRPDGSKFINGLKNFLGRK